MHKLIRTTLVIGLGVGLGMTGCEERDAVETTVTSAVTDEADSTDEAATTVTATTTVIKVNKPKPFESFVVWDKNGDKEVTKAEFEEALAENDVVADWDGDGDGELTDKEFETALYNAWDLNGDEIVDLHEYKDGSGAYFPQAHAFGSFEDYDDDGDKELTMTEYADLGTKVYTDWDGDGDGELTDLEFRTALYNAWDLNGDGIVDHYEYRWN